MELREIRQAEIEARRAELIQAYPAIWARIISEWKSDSSQDRVWLTYSANYLFRTGNFRWAIDPYTLHARLSTAQPVDTAQDLASLSAVLLTHRHADHLDLPTLHSLRHLPIQWVVPEFLLATVENAGISGSRIIVPEPMHRIELHGMKILPYEGRHFNLAPDGEIHGVPEMGYLVEVNDRRWLFPGDTRDYEMDPQLDFGPVDIIFAHLWLGRRGGLVYPPPQLEGFCRYMLAFRPRRIVITHLEEVGRNAHSYWNQFHYDLAAKRLTQMDPSVLVDSVFLGQSIRLY